MESSQATGPADLHYRPKVMSGHGDPQSPIVVVSNRGPLAFRENGNGELVQVRAGGGLTATLMPALAGTGAMWLAAAALDADHHDHAQDDVDVDGIRLRHLPIEPEVYRKYYDVIANGTLWFLHHNLFDLARRPRIDTYWWDAWHTYCQVNQAFATAVAERAPQDAVVMVHDYHLTLLGKALAELRPDLKTIHFHHTPFVGRNSIDVLPPTVVQTLLQGLAGHTACGFHSQNWADNFTLCCADKLGDAPKTFVSAAAPDLPDLKKVAEGAECQAAAQQLEAHVGDRKLIVRVDRIELSKNLLRGFQAYDDLLRLYPRWRKRVTFAAFIYPSRQTLAEYLAYRNEVETLVQQINQEWSTPSWQPIMLHTDDDFPTSVAALLRYDVLLVNPIRDGLNLVAKEGAMLNERNGAVVLSREAGSWHELSDAAIGINPFDILGTTDALVHALEMSNDERVGRASMLRAAATQRTPKDWMSDQLHSLDGL